MVILTREQLEERLAALHRASLELVRDLSLENVLERIVRLAREQSGARYGALGVVGSNGDLVQFIPVGMTPEEVRLTGHSPIGKGMLGALKTERRTIRIPEIGKDARSHGFPANHPPMGSFLGVPILLGDKLLGLIYLTNKEDHFEFTETDERVIEMLAAYAAIAISNAYLYKKLADREDTLTRRNEDLALVDDMAKTLTGSLEIDEILEHTLSRVMNYLEVEAGEIFLREEGSDYLRRAIHRGEAPDAFWTRDNFKVGEGFIGIVAKTGEPLTSTDLQNDVRFLRKSVPEAGFRYLTSIPLIAHGAVIGVMCVATRRERQFDERQYNLFTAIGSWAGITIENARLHRQARRLAVLEERERIGMDMHDGIIQSIYAVGLALDFAKLAMDDDPHEARQKIEHAIEGLNNSIRDIRTYILDLRPRQFRGEDLMQGLQQLIDEFKSNTRAKAVLNGPKNGLVEMPTAHATALFHICQEALANAAKHARAKQVSVNLWGTSDRIILEISDDGRGFDPRKMSATLGHGLSNMHARAHKVGGDVEITSEDGAGTTVLAWVPRRS